MDKFKRTAAEVEALLVKNLEARRAKIKREALAAVKNPKKYYYANAAEAMERGAREVEASQSLKAFEIDYRIKWMPRLKIFRDGDGFEFNPATLETSEGYRSRDGLCRVIKGKMYISGSYVLETVFKVLGIEFKTVNAPAGLNQLNRSVELLASEYGETMIRAKYGRKGDTYRLDSAKDTAREVEVLRGLGAVVPKGILERAVKAADDARTKELKSNAEYRHRSLQWDLERAQKNGAELREVVELTVKLERSKKRRGEASVLDESNAGEVA